MGDAMAQCRHPLASPPETVRLGVIEEAEVLEAASIYLHRFPQRVRTWFRRPDQALCFYADLFELMRLTHPGTFFAARLGERLAGYLILTRPEASLLRTVFGQWFLARAIWHAGTGRYGFSPSLVWKALQSTRHPEASLVSRIADGTPHVYVVAVRPECSGRGIGTALLEQARLACTGRYREISLCVERDNGNAIRLYQRLGFRIAGSDEAEHVMVREIGQRETAETTDMKSTLSACDPDPLRASIYAPLAIKQVARMLSELDRESPSMTRGSADRSHWAWKFQDFPITILQAAFCPLAFVWGSPLPGNPYYRNRQLLEWIEAAIGQTCRRQHANGAFDSVGPHTQDHGVTISLVFYLTEALRIAGQGLSPQIRRLIEQTMTGCLRFASPDGEDYAFISNHHALFALAYSNAADLSGESRYRRQAENVIDRILENQSPEGWYCEYEGPDPGYESLGIFHLAMYWKRTGSTKLLESLRRAVEFYAHCVHPDGSVGGVYGSRHTSLYFPGGFEILAGEIPMAAAVARFMRQRLDRHNVVTPATADMENLIPLTYSYLEACLAGPEPTAVPALPCESLHGLRRFAHSGLNFAGSDNYYAVIHEKKGGVCRVFDRRTEQIAYEDAGYVVRWRRRLYASQFLGLGQSATVESGSEVACEARMAEVRQEVLTPGKFLLLRILNLTAFRSLTLGDWIRCRIVRRLILDRRPGPFRLLRRVRLDADGIQFQDRLTRETDVQVDGVDLPRSFTAIHMGSAKYFHSSELVSFPQADASGMAEELNRTGEAKLEFSIRFPVAPSAAPSEEAHVRP